MKKCIDVEIEVELQKHRDAVNKPNARMDNVSAYLLGGGIAGVSCGLAVFAPAWVLVGLFTYMAVFWALCKWDVPADSRQPPCGNCGQTKWVQSGSTVTMCHYCGWAAHND